MSDSAARSQRAAALEEKRRRLEDLKKRRELRGEDTAKVKASAAANLDEYIDGLLNEPSVVPVATSSEEKKVSDLAPSSVSAVDNAKDAASGTDTPAATEHSMNVVSEPAPAPPPKMVETFTVATQTEDFEEFPEDSEEQQSQTDVEATEQNDVETLPSEPEKPPKILSSEEVCKEVGTEPFSSFINTASKKVERMLGTPILGDLLVDYVGEKDREKAATKDASDKFLDARQLYEAPKWTSSRDVTDLDWSPLHRELLLSTYQMPTLSSSIKGSAAVSAVAPHDTLSSSLTPRSGELQSDGLAVVWNLSMPNRPEHIFTCGSPVTSGRFHATDSTLVIGGCQSGQLVVWDVRSGRLPVQKSALTTVVGGNAKGHTHPIQVMEITEGGAGLVTASTDGRVNFWSLSNLREPVESMQVGDSVSCFAVAPETDALLLGDDHGSIYSVPVSSQPGSQRRRQAKKFDTADAEGENFGHFGMVTSISTKTLKKGSTSRAAGLSKGFLRGNGGLFLSAGVDWTVKLWAPAYGEKPLISLVSHSYDYMSDVRWNPVHPSLFATASSNGAIGLWNLASSLEEPLTGQDGILLDTAASPSRPLNKIRWSADGRRLAVASQDQVHVLTLSETVLRIKGDEDHKVMNQLLTRGLIERQ